MRYDYETYHEGYATVQDVMRECCFQLGIPFEDANQQILDYFMHAAWGVIQCEREFKECELMVKTLTSTGVMFGTTSVKHGDVISFGGENERQV